MPPGLSCSLIALYLVLSNSSCAADSTLNLLDGTAVRSQLMDRPIEAVHGKTAKGTPVRSSTALPAQMRAPVETGKDRPSTHSVEMDAVFSQMEKLVTENESLKKQLAALQPKNAPAKGPSPTARR